MFKYLFSRIASRPHFAMLHVNLDHLVEWRDQSQGNFPILYSSARIVDVVSV